MEIRANYVMVGAFALAIVALAIVYALWAAKSADDRDSVEYQILFKGEVSGLSLSSNVLFNGIKVGTVKKISISPKDSSIVVVLVEIQDNIPIKFDSEASLEMQGVTGQSAIMISSGKNNSPLLTAISDERPPTIKSRASRLQEVVTSLPEILSEAKHTLREINKALTPENIQAFNDILENMRELTANSNDLVVNLNKASINANALFVQLQGTASNLNTNINLVTPGLVRFSGDGLDEFGRLLTDTRQLVNNLNRVTQKLENEPRRFFFGTQVQEYNDGYVSQ